jgi:hypothetical protein
VPRVEPRFTEQAIVMLSPDQLRELRARAEEEDRTVSALLRRMIERYLDGNGKEN